jgi:CDP-diglyceride synthetase
LVPLKNLSIVFASLLAGGALLTIPIYKFNLRRFTSSGVFIKIIFWLPIFLVFLTVLYLKNNSRLAFLIILMLISLAEISRRAGLSRWKYLLYWLLFSAGLFHLILLGGSYNRRFTNILITLVLATVLADVCAYFCGNYLGRHKLPGWLNPRKSLEGAAGEILGAFLGVLAVDLFIEPVISLWLFLPIGLGSVVGDLLNSYFKRQADIKDWSGLIPGHGGVTDRLSSLAGSAALTFYFLKITGL